MVLRLQVLTHSHLDLFNAPAFEDSDWLGNQTPLN